VIVIITYIVGVAHFSHIVAGAVEVFALALAGGTEWREVFLRFIPATLLGNVLGGITLVAALNHAQVVAGRNGESIE
jgi:formate/nitrite transporter FocA (FNT family)